MPSCSAPWAGPASARRTAPRSRRSSTCASGSSLYAGVRPVRAIPGVPAAAGRPARAGHRLRADPRKHRGAVRLPRQGRRRRQDEARETLRITRAHHRTLVPISPSAWPARRAGAARPPGRVTCVDKANVFRAFAFFREVFDERGDAPSRRSRRAHHYVDAMALDLVRQPWDFDVLVTENMFGDILSDLGAGLIGGMGFAPSADIGDAPRGVPAVPRHGARHRRQGHRQPDGDDALGGDDAGLARPRAAPARASPMRRRSWRRRWMPPSPTGAAHHRYRRQGRHRGGGEGGRGAARLMTGRFRARDHAPRPAGRRRRGRRGGGGDRGAGALGGLPSHARPRRGARRCRAMGGA